MMYMCYIILLFLLDIKKIWFVKHMYAVTNFLINIDNVCHVPFLNYVLYV